MDGGTHTVNAMNLPRQTQPKRLVTRERRERQHLVWLLMVWKMPDDIKQHTVGIVVESVNHTLQGIGGEPIVGIKETDILTTHSPKRHVAGMGLSLITVKMLHLDAGITPGIILQHTEGAVGRGIVDTNHLDVGECLSKQRIETLSKKRLCIIDGNKYAYLRHGDGTH